MATTSERPEFTDRLANLLVEQLELRGRGVYLFVRPDGESPTIVIRHPQSVVPNPDKISSDFSAFNVCFEVAAPISVGRPPMWCTF